MNKLILIGNGFDLAHGMKTSYVDFIKWYFKTRIRAGLKREKSDILIQVHINNKYRGITVIKDEELDQWIESWFNNNMDLNRFGEARLDPFGTSTYSYPFVFKVKTELLTKLLLECATARWVDVEAIFYDTLIAILNSTSKTKTIDKEARLKALNESMEALIWLLERYLSSLPQSSINESYITVLREHISTEDLESLTAGTIASSDRFQTPKATLVLNFNYTNTFEQYITREDRFILNTKINYLHGKLGDKQNPIVFGFGDELDKRYPQIENETAKGCFTHMKSFAYLRKSNYQDLVRFVNGEEYQVIILGLSCGLSDRTTLHMIFEHTNCRSIKIYYYHDGTKDHYTETTYEIARHFTEKEVMRRRVVPFTRSLKMPQFDD
jgi:hypothetical protein